MRFGSVCSGIDAASAAWTPQHGGPMNWSCAFFSEIEKFPSAVLAEHYGANMPGEPLPKNGTPNYGDLNNYKQWPDHGEGSNDAIDVLIGGTPCQSFSIAGLRGGLADPRGNLMLTYLGLVDRYRPRWIVWENVPGVLSSWTDEAQGHDGERWQSNDLDTFIGALAQLGYGAAYRVLDAQHVRVDGMERAVPQRRRRVFVVGYLGDWRYSAAVLFDRESVRGNNPPRREAGQGFAGGASSRPKGGSHWDGSGAHPSLNQSHNTGGIGASNQEIFSQRGAGLVAPIAPSLTANDAPRGDQNGMSASLIVAYTAHTLRGEGFDASEDGPGRGTPIIAEVAGTVSSKWAKGSDGPSGDECQNLVTAFNAQQDPDQSGEVSGPLAAGSSQAQAIAYSIMPMNSGKDYKARETNTTQPLMAAGATNGNQGGDNNSHSNSGNWMGLATRSAVRRLTPRECERLQGFPDDYTRIAYRNKAADKCPDGPRYKALGNSMAVNVIRWIGQRIERVERVAAEMEAEKAAAKPARGAQ